MVLKQVKYIVGPKEDCELITDKNLLGQEGCCEWIIYPIKYPVVIEEGHEWIIHLIKYIWG